MLPKSPFWKQPPILDVDFKLRITSRNQNLTTNLRNEKLIDKSNWEPPEKSMPAEILDSIHNINTDLTNLEVHKHPQSLPNAELAALKQLRSNPFIVIKPADKGSLGVIMDKDNYISEGYRQLGNPSHYKKLDEPIFHSTGQKFNEIISDIQQQNFISSKQLLYLKPPLVPRTRRFYLLPKIHKPLDKWPIKNQMPPGRPIISDCDSESYKVAEYIDNFLLEISQKHLSYTKDTYDFLSK